MAHHVSRDIDLGWTLRFRNVLLIRDPVEVVASYVRARESCEPEDIAVPQQGWLLDLWDEHGLDVPVIDAIDFLARPRGAPALAVRLARHPVHRPDAVLAAGAARLRRRLGAALVRGGLEVDGLRAVAPARHFPLKHDAGVAEACRATYERLYARRICAPTGTS